MQHLAIILGVNTTVDFPNNDKVFHNVFSFRDGRKFNLGMYPIGTSKRGSAETQSRRGMRRVRKGGFDCRLPDGAGL